MKTKDILYDLLLDGLSRQEFYNRMMMEMVNPEAVELFKSFRDDAENNVRRIRDNFLMLESIPQIVKTVVTQKRPQI